MADNRGAITNQSRASGISLLLREEEEFQEEQVWDVMNEKDKGEEDSIPKQRKSFSSASSSSSLSAAWRLPFLAAPKMMIPMSRTCVNEGKKLAVNQSSAPLKIPDWSQIYTKKLNMGFWEIDGRNEEIKTGHGCFVEFDDDDNDDDDDEMIPPHVLIDRRLARTRIASYSMLEGIGRTLKGRDLCKLRNAVLTSTGFLEQ